MEKEKNKGIFSRLWTWFKNLTVRGLLRALFVLFLIIVIILILPWIPKAISRISTSLSAALYSVFVPAENAAVTSDQKIINSGEDFTINFKRGDNNTDSLFTVFYDCDQKVNLYSIEAKGLKNIDCNKPYYLLENPTAIKIKAVTKDTDLARVVLTGALENNETQKTETVGVVRITVTNSNANNIVSLATSTNTTNTTKTTTVPKTVSTNYLLPNYYGKADLAVRVLSVGTLSQGSNIIIPKNQFTYNELVGVRFEVRNDGSAMTGPWNFTASLPSISNPTYTSPTQNSLRPGDSIQFTLGFNIQTNQSSGTININVDPNNLVSEDNESNNYTSSVIYSTGGNYNYNNNYNSGCYVNGFYTYNCSNYNNNYNYNSGNFYVSCYTNDNNPETGDKVRWYANVYGGSGNYDYDWTGTNGLNSSSENPTKTYSSGGQKYATVTVTDRYGNRASQTCSVYVDDNNNHNNNDVDLEVEILAVGRMSSNGDFIEDDSISEGDDAAVKFRIRNIGDDDSDDYDYEVTLTPGASGDTYRRTNLAGLNAGESKTFIVSFDNVNDTGSNRFRVEVDPNHDIDDNDRDNNDDTMSIDIN